MFIQKKLALKIAALRNLVTRLNESDLTEVTTAFHPQIKSLVRYWSLTPSRQEEKKRLVKIPHRTNNPELYGEQFYMRDDWDVYHTNDRYSYILRHKYDGDRPKIIIKTKNNYYSTDSIIEYAEKWIKNVRADLAIYEVELTEQIEELRRRLVWCK